MKATRALTYAGVLKKDLAPCQWASMARGKLEGCGKRKCLHAELGLGWLREGRVFSLPGFYCWVLLFA